MKKMCFIMLILTFRYTHVMMMTEVPTPVKIKSLAELKKYLENKPAQDLSALEEGREDIKVNDGLELDGQVFIEFVEQHPNSGFAAFDYKRLRQFFKEKNRQNPIEYAEIYRTLSCQLCEYLVQEHKAKPTKAAAVRTAADDAEENRELRLINKLLSHIKEINQNDLDRTQRYLEIAKIGAGIVSTICSLAIAAIGYLAARPC